MENNVSQTSMLEVAISLMKQKHTKQNIKKLITEVLEMTGSDDDKEKTLSTQLYIDITTSSKFVYMGNEEWDLKERQSLDEWDKDGSAFNSKDDIIEEEIEDDDVFDFDDEVEDEIEEEVEEDEDVEDEEDFLDTNDLDSERDDTGEVLERYNEDDFDEDKYNTLMDDFEDMYEN